MDFFVLLTDEEAFDNALATAYAERMRHGRSWSGYCLPAPLAPSKSPSDIALLEADLSALFRESDGTGRKLKVIGLSAVRAISKVLPWGKSSIIPSTSRDCPSAASNSIVKNQSAEQDGQ